MSDPNDDDHELVLILLEDDPITPHSQAIDVIRLFLKGERPISAIGIVSPF
jgi:hypothetical protein